MGLTRLKSQWRRLRLSSCRRKNSLLNCSGICLFWTRMMRLRAKRCPTWRHLLRLASLERLWTSLLSREEIFGSSQASDGMIQNFFHLVVYLAQAAQILPRVLGRIVEVVSASSLGNPVVQLAVLNNVYNTLPE